MKYQLMKEKTSLLFLSLIIIFHSQAQSLEEGIKLLKYQKKESALSIFENLMHNYPNSYLIKYWYSQSLIENQLLEKAKALYVTNQNTEQDSPFGKVVNAQIELLNTNANLKFALVLFDSAILEAKVYDSKIRKKDKHIYVNILEAIGRANAQGGIKFGDPKYAIKKLNEALGIDNLSSDIPIYLGICYQKVGSESGSEAARSYLESINRNNINPIAYWHIGKIYQAQDNPISMLDYFAKSISADPNFPIVYLSLFEFYKEKDINKAKENLDKYIQLADKDCRTDFYYADYLFRAGKYKESLDKAYQMKNSICKEFEMLPLLLAYNFERLNDSIQSKTNIDNFFDHIPVEQIELAHFRLAEKIYTKFPGSQSKLIDYIKRSYNTDTSSETKKQYSKIISNLYEKTKNYNDEYLWLNKYYSFNKTPFKEIDYYNLCKTAINANSIPDAIKYSKQYIENYPLKPQGYFFYIRSSKLNLSIDSILGPDIYLDALAKQNDYLVKDTLKNKKQLLSNYYNEMSVYANDKKNFKEAMEFCDRYLTISPFDDEMKKNKKKILEILEKEQNK